MCLGTWVSDEESTLEKISLDISERFERRVDAIAAGVARNEQAVFDLSTFEIVSTGGTGTNV